MGKIYILKFVKKKKQVDEKSHLQFGTHAHATLSLLLYIEDCI